MPEPARNRPPAGTAHIRLTGLIGVAQAGVGFWTPCDVSTDEADLATIASDVYDAWMTTILADQVSTASLEQVEVLLYRATDELSGVFAAHNTGGAAGAGFPANVAAVVSWHTPSTWRGGHPRTYVWGVPNSALDGGYQRLSSAYTSALRSNVVLFQAAVNAISLGGGIGLNTMRFFNDNAALAPPYLVSLSSPIVRSVIGSQRRRLLTP